MMFVPDGKHLNHYQNIQIMKLGSVQDIIWACRLAVENTAQDTEVAKRMASVGFPERRVRELENLCTMVEELQHSKSVRYREGLLLSEQIEKEAQTFRPVFMDHIATVRFAFRHEPTLLRTFLPKAIASNKWGWIAQAHFFYQHITPYISQLATQGISQEEVEQAKASVEALMSLRTSRMRKKGEAEDNTEGRNQGVQQLKNLLREFHAAARLALKDHPQKLEAFGIRVRSLQK